MLFVSKIVTSISRKCKSLFVRHIEAVRETAYVRQHIRSVPQSLDVCICETGHDIVRAELLCVCVYLCVDSTAVASAYDLCETGSLIGTKDTVLSVSVYRHVHKIAKSDYWLRHVYLVNPSAWNI
jgi:hypothetical protein